MEKSTASTKASKQASKQELIPAKTKGDGQLRLHRPGSVGPVASAGNRNAAGKEPGRMLRSSDHLCLRLITEDKSSTILTAVMLGTAQISVG